MAGRSGIWRLVELTGQLLLLKAKKKKEMR
jgi:hypothetical protein